MNLGTLSNVLEKLYNRLGNKYLTDNFKTEPFEFKVKVIYDRDDPYDDYHIQIYTVPDIPENFFYKPEVKEEKKEWSDGIHISVLKNKFKEYTQYVDPTSKRYYGIKFMNVKK